MKLLVDLAPDILAEGLEFETHEQAFEMIKAIDTLMADYDFTLNLIRHFVADLNKCGDEPLTAEDIGL